MTRNSSAAKLSLFGSLFDLNLQVAAAAAAATRSLARSNQKDEGKKVIRFDRQRALEDKVSFAQDTLVFSSRAI